MVGVLGDGGDNWLCPRVSCLVYVRLVVALSAAYLSWFFWCDLVPICLPGVAGYGWEMHPGLVWCGSRRLWLPPGVVYPSLLPGGWAGGKARLVSSVPCACTGLHAYSLSMPAVLLRSLLSPMVVLVIVVLHLVGSWMLAQQSIFCIALNSVRFLNSER